MGNIKIGKCLTSKLKNRRVSVIIGESENEPAFYLRFKRLIDKSEIKEFKKNPTVKMSFNKNIVVSEICISVEAAHRLHLILNEIFK